MGQEDRMATIELVEGAVVRAAFEAAVRVGGASAFARRAGVSVTSVSRAMHGEGLGVAIPRALGYEKVVGYVRVGEAPESAASARTLAPGDAEALAAMGLDVPAKRGRRPRPVPYREVPLNMVTGLPDDDGDPFGAPPLDIEQAVLGDRVREANAPEEDDE